MVPQDNTSNIALTTEDTNMQVAELALDAAMITVPMSSEIIIKRGYSPYINENTGTWFEYNNKYKTFIDTGVIARGSSNIYMKTTQEWNDIPSLQAERATIYVYSDYKTIDDKLISGIKIGDGKSFLKDLPFVNEFLLVDDHPPEVKNYVSDEDRANWNSKVSCKLDTENSNILIFNIT